MFKVVLIVEATDPERVQFMLDALLQEGVVSRFKEVSNLSETWEYLSRARLEKLEE